MGKAPEETARAGAVLSTRNGYYYGTRRLDSAWRPWLGWGWLTRGNGEIWVNREAIHIRLFLTRRVRSLPLDRIEEVRVGRWPFRFPGPPAILVRWSADDLPLETGFAISRDRAEAERWAAVLGELTVAGGPAVASDEGDSPPPPSTPTRKPP